VLKLRNLHHPNGINGTRNETCWGAGKPDGRGRIEGDDMAVKVLLLMSLMAAIAAGSRFGGWMSADPKEG
jgi:hypothetical protein